MAANNVKGLTQAKLVALGKQVKTAANSTPTAYGLTTLQITALGDLLTEVDAKIAADVNAHAAAKAATTDKVESLGVLANTLCEFAKIIYAHPGITDTQIETAGFAIPQKPAKRTPKEPTNLNAVPTPSGDVNLSWKRNGNTKGIMFTVEQAPEMDGPWSNVVTTTASKVTLKGYTPGVSKFFRVTASTRGLFSTPSLAAVIYANGSQGAELKLAA